MTTVEDISPATKAYGLQTLTLLVIASMVGAGVFTTSGYTLAAVGSPGRVMLCWGIGGLIALCGAVAYGRLAALVPQSGGEYLFLTRHAHPVVGFLAGWVSLTAGFSGAIAIAAVAFEEYAFPEAWRSQLPFPDSVAILLVLLCGVIHGMPPRLGGWAQNAVVAVKLSALSIFAIVVATRLFSHDWHFQPTSPVTTDVWDATVAVATSLVWISMSYAGFNAAIYVASESAEARRNVPRALLLGTLLVTALYLLLNLIFVSSVPAEKLAGQEAVAAISAFAIGGRPLEVLMRVAISLGLMSSVLGSIMTGPRVYSKMADDGVFPGWFRFEGNGTKGMNGIRRSVALQTGIAIGLITLQRILVATGAISESLLGLLFYVGTTLSLSSAMCVATLFLPGVRRQAEFPRSVVGDIAAAVYVVATLLAIVLMVQFRDFDGNPQGGKHLLGALVTLATGTLAWWWIRRSGSDRAATQSSSGTEP